MTAGNKSLLSDEYLSEYATIWAAVIDISTLLAFALYRKTITTNQTNKLKENNRKEQRKTKIVDNFDISIVRFELIINLLFSVFFSFVGAPTPIYQESLECSRKMSTLKE